MSDRLTVPVDLDRSAVARYIQLATLFRRRIQSKQWPIGSQLPTVEDLSAEFGVARATIRQSLDALENEGLIERFRAKGTFVRRWPQEDLWCAVATDWDGLLRPNHDAKIEILSQKEKSDASGIVYPIGELAAEYRKVHRRHWRAGKPFLITNLYIEETLMKRLKKADLESKTALRLISDIPGVEISDVRQTLTIGTADAETAAALDMPINAPIAFVYRRAVDSKGRLVLAAEGIYRGDVVKFEIKLR